MPQNLQRPADSNASNIDDPNIEAAIKVNDDENNLNDEHKANAEHLTASIEAGNLILTKCTGAWC
jgi:hypothetical protein